MISVKPTLYTDKCESVWFQHQLALDHPQERTRHSTTPSTPSAPLSQLPLQLKYQPYLRIHHGQVRIQCTPVNNNSYSLSNNVQVCVCVNECSVPV